MNRQRTVTKSHRAAWLLSLTALLLSGCIRREEPVGFRVAVIPRATQGNYWRAVHAGAVKASEELKIMGVDVEVEWKGSRREDPVFQAQMVETLVASGINGIVLAPSDPEVLKPSLKVASEAGVPVVLIDTDMAGQDDLTLVATDHGASGKLAGDFLIDSVEGLDVVVVWGGPSPTPRAEARRVGVEQACEAKGVEVLSVAADGGTSMRDHARETLAFLWERGAPQEQESPAPGPTGSRVALICLNTEATEAMLGALRERGRGGVDLHVLGFEGSEANLRALKLGDLGAVVVENPMGMGEIGVAQLMTRVLGRKAERGVNTGVVIVTKDDIQPGSKNYPQAAPFFDPPIDQFLKGRADW